MHQIFSPIIYMYAAVWDLHELLLITILLVDSEFKFTVHKSYSLIFDSEFKFTDTNLIIWYLILNFSSLYTHLIVAYDSEFVYTIHKSYSLVFDSEFVFTIHTHILFGINTEFTFTIYASDSLAMMHLILNFCSLFMHLIIWHLILKYTRIL